MARFCFRQTLSVKNMCPASDIESRGSSTSVNGDQHLHSRNYNEETMRTRSAEDKFIHGFLRKIQVNQLLRWLPLNETREPLNQASLPPLPSQFFSFFVHHSNVTVSPKILLHKNEFIVRLSVGEGM
ncbi:Uncharacterized protein TCM_019725 [Theobroma cacao]|uniref:Uncharacterized protein n=1 Tax=Theobroma cacao TaxID=3641 RepID=A0A061EJ85_THECC|nr:Uncharacterized protein TCM_019725 [Theobroma cacao]